MINHDLTIEQGREADGAANFLIRCRRCGWQLSIGRFFGTAKDCPESITDPAATPATYLTTAQRIDLTERLKTDSAEDIAVYLTSRLMEEAEANMAHDHWHPTVSGPLQDMAAIWQAALERADVEFEYQRM